MADTLTLEEIPKMKVADLKKALKDKGLVASGSKTELVERLTEAINPEEATTAESDLSDAVLEDSEKGDEPKVTKPVIATIAPQMAKSPEKTDEASAPAESEKPAESAPSTRVAVSSPMSDTEKIKKRAERFGLVAADAKKQARAERFGLPASPTSTTATGADLDTLKKRAERFGTVTAAPLSKQEEAERLKKRKDRFGDVTSKENNTTPPKFAKITFDTPSAAPPAAEDDKKKQRAERFAAKS